MLQNVKCLRQVVDHLSASVLNTKVDLHKMLGKVEDSKDTSEFEKSANKSMGLSPGANYPSVITLFRSPEVYSNFVLKILLFCFRNLLSMV